MFDRAGWKMPEEYLYLWDTSTTFYPRDGKMTFEPMEENFKDGVRGMIPVSYTHLDVYKRQASFTSAAGLEISYP